VLTDVDAVTVVVRVEVAALGAVLRLHGRSRLPVGIVLHAHQDAVHPVAGALVVDQGAGRELGDREEARTSDVVVTVLLLAATSRDERRQRQAREVVARKEAFAGEVAVAVEVGLDRGLDVEQQVALADRFVVQAPGAVALGLWPRAVVPDRVVHLALAVRRAEEVAPPRERLLELAARLLEQPGQPVLGEPAGPLQLGVDALQHGSTARIRTRHRVRVLEVFEDRR
jgi:hypothetical protein